MVRGVVDHAGHDYAPERRVGLSVATAVESVSFVFAAAGVDWGDAAEVGEGAFVAEPLGVVAGGDEQSGGALDADPEPGQELGGGVGDEWFEDGVEFGGFGLEWVCSPDLAPLGRVVLI